MYPEEVARLRKFIKEAAWIEAKTYAKTWPHEYCLLARMNTDELRQGYFFMCSFIKRAGIVEPFYKTKNTYLHLDGMKYWTMEKPGQVPILMNRALIADSYTERLKSGKPLNQPLVLPDDARTSNAGERQPVDSQP